MHVWLVTEIDSADRTYVLRVTSTRDGGKRVAELDFHERVDGELDWQDDVVGDGTSFAKTDFKGTAYLVKRAEVME